mmetsp:Transcript_35993/g.92015  ORF Transcript_35993/g.92015 Transcript_35993/m.92015 type:complete len:966 (-) Transcript_35993:293-3190(-)
MHGAAGHMPPPSIPMHRPGAGVPVTAGLGGVAHARYGFPGRGPAVPVSAPPAAYMSNFVFHDYNKGANSMTRAAIPRLHNATPRIHESKVIIGRKIGSGSVGNVYAGTFEEHPVAIKQHKMDGGPPDAKALQEFEIEVGKMTAVNHPCIVRCYGMLEPTPGIVLELVNGGSLFHILHAKRDESFQSYQLRLPWPVRMRYMLDSLYGLRAVHSAGMIHGDFKTLNMLVGPDHRVKVADFGLSKCIGTLTVIPGTKTITGTPQYMAPEIMQSLPQSMRVDMYSVGIVMWEVLTGQIPWFGMDIVQIIQQVTLKANETQFPPPGRPPLQNHHVRSAPVGYVKLMQEAWSQHPNDRPTTDTCVQVLESIHQSHGMYPFRENQEGPLQYQMPAHTPQLSLPLQNAAGPAVHRGKTPRISTLDIPPSSSAVPAGTLTNIPAHFNALLEAPLGAPVATSNQWKPPEGGTLNPPPIFLAAGGMEMLIDMMHGSKDEFTQAQGAGAVFEACFNNPSNQKALANATGQGLHAMVALLRSGTPDLQSKAAQAIAAACGSNEANRAAVVLAGGIEALVRLLGGSNTAAMENAANALANVIKQRAGVGESLPGARQAELEGLRQLRVHGGIQALMAAMKGGTPRVKEAATAAVANAMEFCNDTRKAFQEAGGIRVVLDVLQSADPHAQENATTALWNSMVDNEDACTQVVQLGGIPILVQQVMAGTEVGQELAAGAIWKACASDPSVKDEVRMAIPGLVQLVATGTQGAKEHAAGALRSACINSAQNKEELNKCGGVEALIGLIRDGNPRAGEQAGAALANALANCEANQIAAANAGGMEVLLSVLDQEHDKTSEIVSGCVSVLRNMCAGNRLRQEKLGQLGGVKKLVACVPGNIEDMNSRSMVLTSYLLGALWKACTRCEANRETLRAIFMDKLEALKASEFVSSEVRQGALNVLNVLSSPAGSPTGGSPPEPSKST